MNLGFSGTRNGMTEAQKAAFENFLLEHEPASLHHGDCVGSDDQAADIYSNLLLKGMVVCHPPVDETHRAFNKRHISEHHPKTHFARNRAIVEATDMLVATPLLMERQEFGGTWYTIDFAVKKGRKVFVIWPDGRVEEMPK